MERTKRGADAPWYERTHRFGQTNLTECDPGQVDFAFWRDYWQRTRVQGVIINAGGIVAYYPSAFPLQYRAAGLGDGDLLGAFVQAAREAGLAVLARMDCNRAGEDFYRAHPDWFVVDASGTPVMSQGRYFSCVNSGYYKETIPLLLREIIGRVQPDGFCDNSWSGVDRNTICHCKNCREKFLAERGHKLPEKADWEDPVYRIWLEWSYRCRMENWDLFNEVTRKHGGKDCLWIGMVNANPVQAARMLVDLKAVGERTPILLCDHQSRDEGGGFADNGTNGALLHGLAGWDAIIPESMACYVRGARTFRRSASPPAEVGLWAAEGIAGGISPWYHHVGAVQEDLRQFKALPALFGWHEENDALLHRRKPLANVGLVWSRENIDFYGKGSALERVALPWKGFTRAMTRARIPFLPVNADHILREAEGLDVLILPSLGVLTTEQAKAVCEFVGQGKSLILTGESGCYDGEGKRCDAFPLEDVTGLCPTGERMGAGHRATSDWADYTTHSYLRVQAAEHPLFAGLAETAILPFGGVLHGARAKGLQALATYIPSFPLYPPEFSWTNTPDSGLPAILCGETPYGGRLVYFAGDIDRCYGRAGLPDHGQLLGNAVRFALGDKRQLEVEGPGILDVRPYRQEGKILVHLINLNAPGAHEGYAEEVLPVGPVTVRVKTGIVPKAVRACVSGKSLQAQREAEWLAVTLPKLQMHELLVFEE